MSSDSSNSFQKTFAQVVSGSNNMVSKPQTEPLRGQVENNAGGYCFQVTDETYIRRIIIMGTASPTYYSSSKTITTDAVNFILRKINEGQGRMVLDILKDVHSTGAAPKMDMTFAILGLLTRCEDDAIRKKALNYTIYGLRTMSQVYSWLSYHMKSGKSKGKGFGRGPKTVLTKRFHNVNYQKPFSTNPDPRKDYVKSNPRKYWRGISAMDMAYQFSKYDKRNGISIGDVMSLVHMKPTTQKRSDKYYKANITGNKIKVLNKKVWPRDKQMVLEWAKTGFVLDIVERRLYEIAVDNGDAKWDFSLPPRDMSPPTKLDNAQFHSYNGFQKIMDTLPLSEEEKKVVRYLWACEFVKKGVPEKMEDGTVNMRYDNPARIAQIQGLIKTHKLPREVLNTEYLKDTRIWLSLLLVDPYAEQLQVNMPITALIRNLGVMSSKDMFNTSVGSFEHRQFTEKLVNAVRDHITNENVIIRGRVHPVAVLQALKTYRRGRGTKGSLSWSSNPIIVQALESAINIAFKCVHATGCDEMHFIDISGSMSTDSAIPGISAMEAMTIQMLAFVKASLREQNGGRQIIGVFDTEGQIVFDSDPTNSEKVFATNADSRSTINSFREKYETSWGLHYYDYGQYCSGHVKKNIFDPESISYSNAKSILQNFRMGGTDCAVPIMRAYDLASKGLARVENIYVYTDNETWFGNVHPTVALKEYRKLVPNAKLIVVAATPTKFTIADPADAGMLDVVGFDTGAPNVIYDFAKKS